MFKDKVKWLVFGVLSVLAVVWALAWPIGNKLVICATYADIADGTQISAGKEYNYEGFTEDSFYKGRTDGGIAYINLRWNHEGMTGLAIKPTDGTTPVLMNGINVFLNTYKADNLVCQYAPALVMEKFDITDGKWHMDDSGFIRIEPENENCAIVTKDTELADAILDFDDSLKRQIRVWRFSSVVLLLALTCFILLYADKIWAYFEKLDSWGIISILAIIVAGASVWTIAFKSGMDHPDETDVVKCLDWAMTHFFPPDMRLPELADTYSGYGYTKLANPTWYFLIAGKVAFIAGKLWPGILYYRVPNVILFAVMAFIYIREISRKKWLTIALGISAQAWYIFSYTTADALDFFLAFVALVILTDKDCILYRTLNEGFKPKNIWKLLLLGILFGFIFMGKQNYWVVLALAFVVLLFNMFDEDKEGFRRLLVNYLIIVGFFALTVLTRKSFDFYHYGFNMGAVEAEMEVLHSSYDMNPTTPPNEIAPTFGFSRYGRPFSELFMAAPTWFKTSYRSFCGLLSDRTTGDIYYKVMGILYGFVIASLMYFGYKNKKDVKGRVKLSILFALSLSVLAASIGISYFWNSQPQGRYLLPMLIVTSYIAYETPEVLDKKYFKAAIITLQVLSAWYFAARGVACFI